MDKRFFSFILVTILIWGSYVSLRLLFFPPKPLPEQEVAEVDKPGDVVPPAAEGKVDPESNTDKPDTVPAEPKEAAPAEPAVPAAAVQPPARRVTLGSLDPGGNYRMLVTLNSRGAAVERVELSDPKYQDIEDLHGYLGHLALKATDGGCRVEVVGPGTPAALADLREGDVLTAVDLEPIREGLDLDAVLKKSRPKQTVVLAIKREENGGLADMKLSATLIRRPIQVIQPEVHTYADTVEADPPSLRWTFDTIGGTGLKRTESELAGLPSLLTGVWETVDHGADFAEFKTTLTKDQLKAFNVDGTLEVTKRFELKPEPAVEDKPPRDYHLTMAVTIRNGSPEPLKTAYRLEGFNGLPTEGWWYFGKLNPEMGYGAGARDIVVRLQGGYHRLLGGPRIQQEVRAALEAKKDTKITLIKGNQPAGVDYIGVDTQFFAAALLPIAKDEKDPPQFRSVDATAVHDVRNLPKRRERLVNSSFELTSVPFTIPAEGEWKQEYTVFLGPKEPRVLNAYSGLASLIEYGWQVFAIPAQMLRGTLDFLYRIVPNYGIAIILLTLIVRSCMLPFSIRQAKSAAKMQELAPEMQKLREKYKDDMEKQGKAMQELYAKHNFNPFGGCLLVFFQLPVFVGLYRCLAVDIDLRNAALIPGVQWASNLAGPDRLFYWKDAVWPVLSDEANGWLGPYFNVLPIITMVLFIIQQKMFTPPATDEQTQMQQKMMTYMTVFMGVLFYKVPTGLCLYIITSSLWGICERQLLPKSKPGDAVATKTPPAKPTDTKTVSRPASKPNNNGKKKRK